MKIFSSNLGETVCPVCGKCFCVPDPEDWAYSRNGKTSRIYYCSWKCIRTVPDKKRGRPPTEKKDQILALIDQGMRYSDIAKKIGCSETSVRYWEERR